MASRGKLLSVYAILEGKNPGLRNSKGKLSKASEGLFRDQAEEGAHSLSFEQGLANYTLCTKSRLQPVFVNVIGTLL